MQHVVMFSGGAGSWMTAKRVAEKHGTDNLILLFADTLIEDEDLYRFLDEAAANVGGQLIKVAEGRDPWQVFFDVRFLGNSRVDPCSWTEAHRFERAQRYWVPWRVEAPLCSPPYLTKDDILAALRAEGIRPPRLYELGFSHNNCGGFCVKAGQGHFALLYRTMPERYLYHERREQELRDFLGKNVAILVDRRGGGARPMTLREFRERLEANDKQLDLFEWGGCGCFSAAGE